MKICSGKAGRYQCLHFCVTPALLDAPRPRRLGTLVSGGLVASGLLQDEGFVGKGQGFDSLSPTRHCDQLQKVFSQSDSDCNLLWDGDHEPLFEGFSFPRECFDPALTDHRISVLQTAKRRCLLGRLFSVCHLVPSCCLCMRSLQLVLRDLMGLRGRVGCDFLDSLDRIRPELVVRHVSSSCGCFLRLYCFGQMCRSGLGSEPPRPVRLGSLVTSGAGVVH